MLVLMSVAALIDMRYRTNSPSTISKKDTENMQKNNCRENKRFCRSDQIFRKCFTKSLLRGASVAIAYYSNMNGKELQCLFPEWFPGKTANSGHLFNSLSVVYWRLLLAVVESQRQNGIGFSEGIQELKKAYLMRAEAASFFVGYFLMIKKAFQYAFCNPYVTGRIYGIYIRYKLFHIWKLKAAMEENYYEN